MSKNFIYYIISAITLECFHIVTYSYTALFSIKTRFYETYIFYFKNQTDLCKKINCSWKYIQNKSNVTLKLFEILLTSAVIWKQIFGRKRDCEVSSKLQIPTLIKAILQSLHKFLQILSKTTILRQPIHFITGRSILSYFLRKFFNQNFFKLHFSLSKQAKIYILRATQQEVTTFWKFLKVTCFLRCFFLKRKR